MFKVLFRSGLKQEKGSERRKLSEFVAGQFKQLSRKNLRVSIKLYHL